jgi:TRAP-type C4-dicarboxylate transport system permease small subunit
MALVAESVVAVFAGAVLVYGGYVLVGETLRAGQLTSALGIRQGYVYLAVPISGMFILLFCLERIVELLAGRGSTPPTAAMPASQPTRPARRKPNPPSNRSWKPKRSFSFPVSWSCC